MLYMASKNGETKIIVLESKNLERIKAGQPAVTPDDSVIIAWTPDPVWLADKLMEVKDGDPVKIGALIEEAAKRPQKPDDRPVSSAVYYHVWGVRR